MDRAKLIEALWAVRGFDSPEATADAIIAEHQREVERLREALEFYAYGIGHRELEDNGAIALAALGSTGKVEPTSTCKNCPDGEGAAWCGRTDCPGPTGKVEAPSVEGEVR